MSEPVIQTLSTVKLKRDSRLPTLWNQILLTLGSAIFVPSRQDVISRRQIGNRKRSLLIGHGIVRVIEEVDESQHVAALDLGAPRENLAVAKVGGAVTQYEYDAENKLVRVVSPSNTRTMSTTV